jgi:hypothetical protein
MYGGNLLKLNVLAELAWEPSVNVVLMRVSAESRVLTLSGDVQSG